MTAYAPDPLAIIEDYIYQCLNSDNSPRAKWRNSRFRDIFFLSTTERGDVGEESFREICMPASELFDVSTSKGGLHQNDVAPHGPFDVLVSWDCLRYLSDNFDELCQYSLEEIIYYVAEKRRLQELPFEKSQFRGEVKTATRDSKGAWQCNGFHDDEDYDFVLCFCIDVDCVYYLLQTRVDFWNGHQEIPMSRDGSGSFKFILVENDEMKLLDSNDLILDVISICLDLYNARLN